MPASDMTELRDALITAQAFLVRMLTNARALYISGPNALAEWDGYAEAVAALGSLELRLANAVVLAKQVAPELQDKLKGFSDKSPVAIRSAELAVNVRIAGSRKLPGSAAVLARKTAAVFGYFAGGGLIKKLFSKRSEDLPLHEMVVDIERLLPLIEVLAAAPRPDLAKPEPGTT